MTTEGITALIFLRRWLECVVGLLMTTSALALRSFGCVVQLHTYGYKATRSSDRTSQVTTTFHSSSAEVASLTLALHHSDITFPKVSSNVDSVSSLEISEPPSWRI